MATAERHQPLCFTVTGLQVWPTAQSRSCDLRLDRQPLTQMSQREDREGQRQPPHPLLWLQGWSWVGVLASEALSRSCVCFYITR